MTELGYAGELPTNDFLRWHGQRFKPKPKTESRGGKVAQGVAEKRHTDGGEIRHTRTAKCGGKVAHELEAGRGEKYSISRVSMPEGTAPLTISPPQRRQRATTRARPEGPRPEQIRKGNRP
jgi:hypothetical protein